MDEPPSKALLAILSDAAIIELISFVGFMILLMLCAFISASEKAFFSMNAQDLQRLGNSVHIKERNVADLIKNPHRLLATMLALGVFVSTALISLATFLFNDFINFNSDNTILIGLFTIISILFLSVLFVIVPRIFAARFYLKFAIATSGFWNFMTYLCSPVSRLITSSWKRLEYKSRSSSQKNVTESLNQAFELAAESEEATEDEREILKGIANFGSLTVKQVMHSRVDISAIDIDIDFHQLMDQVNKSGFSRMPVYKNTIDKIDGVLYIKDLLPFIEHDEKFVWQKLIRQGFFVPENKKLDALLKDFQRKHIHIAIVVDEYGGTLGIITLEDIIEEIIGDINDEFDDEGGVFRKVDENTFVFEGKTSLHDFCKALDVDMELFEPAKGESESLGGLILELNDELPGVGKKISFEQFTFVIEAVDKKRVKRVRVNVHEPKES